EAEDIKKAFEPYYEVTQVEDTTDPNILYDLQTEIDACQVYADEEIDEVVKLEYSDNKKNAKLQEKLNSILDRAVNRFKQDLNKEQQDDFKAGCSKFIRTYLFILKICLFADIELIKLYIYINYLFIKLIIHKYNIITKLYINTCFQSYKKKIK